MVKGAKIHRDKVKNNAFTKILRNIFFLGPREMAQGIRVLIAFLENLGLILSTRM